MTSAPTIVRNVVVVGHQVLDGQKEDAPSGVIRGYDAETGELAWAWDMGRPGETGMPAEGEQYTRGTPNAWTTFSADDELGLVYVPMGNSAVDYFSGNRRLRAPLLHRPGRARHHQRRSRLGFPDGAQRCLGL